MIAVLNTTDFVFVDVRTLGLCCEGSPSFLFLSGRFHFCQLRAARYGRVPIEASVNGVAQGGLQMPFNVYNATLINRTKRAYRTVLADVC